jgi:hypothetical protein
MDAQAETTTTIHPFAHETRNGFLLTWHGCNLIN